MLELTWLHSDISWEWNDCIELASSTVNGNCKTVISTSTKLNVFCKPTPWCATGKSWTHVVLSRKTHPNHTVNVLWHYSAMAFLSTFVVSRSVFKPWHNLYACMIVPPGRSLDTQRMLWNNSSFCVPSCVNNASKTILHVFMRVWIGYLCKASY